MLGRSVTLNVLGQVAGLLLGFVTSILLARVLGPSDRGLLALLSSVSYLALLFTGAGIPVAISYYAGQPGTRANALVGNSLVYAAGLAMLLVPLSALFYEPIAGALSRGRGGEAWILAAVLVPVMFLDWAVNNQLVGELRFTRYNALLVAGKLGYLVAIVVLLWVLELGVAAALLASAVGSAVVIAGGLRFLLPRARPVFDGPLLRQVLRYGARVQLGALFQLAVTRVDVLIVQAYRPLAEVGQYVVAQTIAELPMFLALAFKTSVLPLIARAEEGNRDVTTALSIRNYALVAGVAVLGNAAFGALVILVAYGSQFEPAVVPMLVLLPGIWFLGLGTVVSGDLQGRGRPGLSSRLAGVAALLTVGLDFVLIPPFGVVGAAVASLFAYAVFGIASVIALARLSAVGVGEMMIPRRSDVARYRDALSDLGTRLSRRRAGG